MLIKEQKHSPLALSFSSQRSLSGNGDDVEGDVDRGSIRHAVFL